MDEHVKQMGELTALISEVKSQSTTETQRVSAQLDGLHSTMEAHTTTTKADLVDLRGRIVPSLRDKSDTIASDVQRLEAHFDEQTTALASTVQRLEDRLGNFDPTDFTRTVDCFEERLDALRVELGDTTSRPRGACIPPVDVTAGAHVSPTEAEDAMPRSPDIGGGRFAHIDPTFRPTSSRFARDTPLLDASAIRDYKPGVQCDACKRIGHDAVNCDMLAIALYIDRYTKDISATDRSTIESRWLDKYRAKLGQPGRTPRQIMRTFCDNYNITPNHLDQAMDWDCWPDSDPDELSIE